MKRVLMTVMLTAMGITGSMLFAAEPVTKTTTPSPTAAPTKDAKATHAEPAQADAAKVDPAKPDAKTEATAAAKPAGASAASDEEKASHASAADKAPSPQRFTPSEQVRADFDVSFPVDI